MEAHERILHDLLPRAAIVEQQAGEAHKRAVLVTEQAHEQFVAVDGDRFPRLLGRHRAHHHHGRRSARGTR
jgi:hypothetical protein